MALSSKQTTDFLRSFNSRQNWSFPDLTIYQITQNPSTPKIYQKLIRCCKYFFIKNPILVISKANFKYGNEWKISSSEMNIYHTAKKIWITKRISNFGIWNLKKNNPLSSLIPKIFKCDIKELNLSEQNIFFDDLIFIASKCETIIFSKVTVMNENGSIFPLEKIIDVLPNLEIFEYYFSDDNSSHIITSKTVKELLRMPHFSILSYFKLSEIPEDFDIESFYEYIKKNKKTQIWLNFSQLISIQYKNRLQTIVNEILETKNHNNNVPYIYFSGMNQS